MTVTISENAANREKPTAEESKDQNEPAEIPAQAEGEN